MRKYERGLKKCSCICLSRNRSQKQFGAKYLILYKLYIHIKIKNCSFVDFHVTTCKQRSKIQTEVNDEVIRSMKRHVFSCVSDFKPNDSLELLCEKHKQTVL